MEKPPLQRCYTYSVRAFEGLLSPRLARAVQRACNGWHESGIVGMAEMPAELKLRVDLEFIIWPEDGSIQIATDAGVLDLGRTRHTTHRLWARLTGRLYLPDLLHWAIGRVLMGDFTPLKPSTINSLLSLRSNS